MEIERNEFYVGEQRYLDFEVRTVRKEPFSIVDATYTVTNNRNETIDSGSAVIDNGNNTVRLLLPLDIP